MSMTILAPVYVALTIIAQAPAGGPNAADTSGERLKFMKDSVRSYELTLGGDRGAILKLQEKPVFRLGKQYATDLEDGAIFVWTGENGRPEAAIQVFQVKYAQEPRGRWMHEFTSLAPTPFTALRSGQPWWSPTTPGLEFKPVPDAPKPAQSAAQRARQMRALAEGFRASDAYGTKGWSELRLLPTPISRYGESGTKLVDGALFAFVIGTDPEVFLFLEARPAKQGLQWEYALAPMTVYAVKGSYQGTAGWELPDRQPSADPSKPFFDKWDVP
jgi:hypothetical protein